MNDPVFPTAISEIRASHLHAAIVSVARLDREIQQLQAELLNKTVARDEQNAYIRSLRDAEPGIISPVLLLERN